MLLKPQALPLGLKNWAAEIVETTALEDSVTSYAPTGHTETYPSREPGGAFHRRGAARRRR